MNKLIMGSIGILLYILSGCTSSAKITAVYKESDSFENTVFVVLQNPPTSNQAMLVFWDNNKDLLKTKYNIDITHIKSILFLKDSYENYNKDTEDQFCFHKEIAKEPACIDKEKALLIISKFDDGVLSFGFSQPNCSFIETVEVGRSTLTCY